MLQFQKLTPDLRAQYEACLTRGEDKGCEYAFVNLNLWGRQRVTLQDGFFLLFSQFDRISIYPFPVGSGDIKAALDAIIQDARRRGIPCRISSMTEKECAILEGLYPGKFQFHTDRDDFDYVYAVDDLADLRGKRYQSKRNFVNRFCANYPDHQLLPLTAQTVPMVRQIAEQWYADRHAQDPLSDHRLEQIALGRALEAWEALGLEGLILTVDGRPIAFTMGSHLRPDTFDVHFEKALDGYDGAYPMINQSFARHLREKYPALAYLNREDDMGLPGLRKAKLSYHPHHLVEKHWARLWEEDDAN